MQRTTFFTPETLRFLAELRRHNNRRWFEANKPRYLSAVRDQCLRFIVMAGPHLQAISPYVTANPHPTRGSLFRIYRDTRFSADKHPYKTHAGMHFRHAAAKNVHAPGYYLHIEPENCFVAAGLWRPETPALTRVRQTIARTPEDWRAAVRKLELEGETLRNPPHGFAADHPLIEDLKRKDFVTSIAFLDDEVCSPNFLRLFIRACRQMSPLMAFLCGALKLEY